MPGRLGTVRVRTTVAAVLVVGLALVVAATVLVGVLRSTLTEEVQDAAGVEAEELAAVIEAGGSLPAWSAAERDEQLVQVLDPAGRVVGASPNIAGRPPVARLAPGESAQLRAPIDEDAFVAVAVAARSPNGPRTVIVARALIGVQETTDAVLRLLAIGLPALAVLLALTTWMAVGRALAPVEAIRREVDGISADQLHRRVPESPAGDEIARLAGTMNRMLDRLESAQASQRRFISDASHELRSPVAAIRQLAEITLAHPERIPAGELAGTALAESLRLQQLIDDLLLLAKADEHMLRLDPQEVDLDDLVFEHAQRLRTATGLRVDLGRVSAGRVPGDPVSLRRLLRNLTDNAGRHARERVAFALAERAGSVVLGIEDDGPGIPVELRERVFERFVRLDDARARDDGGSGLGLAIVADIVRVHGGSVTIGEGTLGGAAVRVVLPALG
jgi:signal transduction histidine kinase